MKEETVLYPLAGRSLPDAREAMDRMRSVRRLKTRSERARAVLDRTRVTTGPQIPSAS